MGVRLSAVSETTTTTVALHPEQLRDIGLFGGLSDEALLRLAGELVVLRVDPGVEVAREGDDAHEMFAVLAGELEVVRRSKGGVEGRRCGGNDSGGSLSRPTAS